MAMMKKSFNLQNQSRLSEHRAQQVDVKELKEQEIQVYSFNELGWCFIIP